MSVGLRGRVVVDKDAQLSHEAIRSRLQVLEHFLLGGGTRRDDDQAVLADATAGGSLADRARALEEDLNSKETHDVKIFHIGLADIGPRLGDWAKPTVPADSVPDEVKQRVVLAEAEDMAAACKQLEEITSLQAFVNPSYLNEMPVYLERVSKLEAGYVALAQEAGAFQQEVHKTLKDYNELVDLLSLKAAEWDAALRALEDKVEV
jgi:hypothetical protein